MRSNSAHAEPAAVPLRLQKVLAQALGVSRRTADDWITAGRITVAGQTATPGLRINSGERIQLDGEPVPMPAPVPRHLILYHKPVGEECSWLPDGGRKSIFAKLPPLPGNNRWISVGRLDVTTSGLLLLSSDGAVAHQLMHPSAGYDREYLVRLRGSASEAALKRLVQGVQLDDGVAQFADLVAGPDRGGHNRWYCVTLMQGRNRLIHRLFASEGLEISRLHRIRFGAQWLPRDLRPGQWRELKAREIEELLASADTAAAPAATREAPAATRATAPDELRAAYGLPAGNNQERKSAGSSAQKSHRRTSSASKP